MQSIHGLGATLAASAERVADDDARHGACDAATSRDRLRQLPHSKTAFTDAALWRALLASVEPPRPALSTGGPGASPPLTPTRAVRWCGATPLAQKRAAWQKRRQERQRVL